MSKKYDEWRVMTPSIFTDQNWVDRFIELMPKEKFEGPFKGQYEEVDHFIGYEVTIPGGRMDSPDWKKNFQIGVAEYSFENCYGCIIDEQPSGPRVFYPNEEALFLAKLKWSGQLDGLIDR